MIENIELVTAFICERVLYEQDGVLSAIRLADVFFIPENRPADVPISFSVVVTIKFKLGFVPEKNTIRLTIVRHSGDREVIGELPVEPVKKKVPGPVGVGVILQVQLVPRNLGTGYIEAAIADELIARIPFTLAPPLQQPSTQN